MVGEIEKLHAIESNPKISVFGNEREVNDFSSKLNNLKENNPDLYNGYVEQIKKKYSELSYAGVTEYPVNEMKEFLSNPDTKKAAQEFAESKAKEFSEAFRSYAQKDEDGISKEDRKIDKLINGLSEDGLDKREKGLIKLAIKLGKDGFSKDDIDLIMKNAEGLGKGGQEVAGKAFGTFTPSAGQDAMIASNKPELDGR